MGRSSLFYPINQKPWNDKYNHTISNDNTLILFIWEYIVSIAAKIQPGCHNHNSQFTIRTHVKVELQEQLSKHDTEVMIFSKKTLLFSKIMI